MKRIFAGFEEPEKENYSNKKIIDFKEKFEVAYWAFKLKITKSQLQAARRKTGSTLVTDIEAYINKKFMI